MRRRGGNGEGKRRQTEWIDRISNSAAKIHPEREKNKRDKQMEGNGEAHNIPVARKHLPTSDLEESRVGKEGRGFCMRMSM